MAQLTGPKQLFEGDTTVVDSTAKHELGTKGVDASGNEYVYMLGVASTAAGSAVTFDEAFTTTLTVASAVGMVAIAMAATIAATYGWYCVKGTCGGLSGAAVADNLPLYLHATAGTVDDAAVAGDYIFGMFSRSAPTGAGAITLQISYPFVSNSAYLT